jgi:serine/threonine protein kinase
VQTEKNTPCPDDQTLRQVCMGDAPAPLSEQTLAHVEQCPACPGRIDSLWQKAYQHPSTAQNGALPQGIRNAPTGRPNPLASLLARTGASHNLAFLKPSPYADMLGRLGPYDLIRVIGSGGNGIVFEAVDSREEGPSVAVKCLRPGRLGNPTTQERFFREAATPASIAHPGVPPILDHGIDGEVPYLVMPLLRGTDFNILIQHHAPLPVAETIRLLEQICDILQAAHAKGIIHRDIKPSNLWLEKSPSGDSRVLLLDYGLATLAGEGSQLTQTGDMIGTPAYFSPEQAEGFTHGITPATDLFSLGAVAYELLTGRRVFPGQTPLEILRNMARFKFAHPKDLRPEIPQRLSDLVMSLLAWQPARRPDSAAAVVQKLRHPALMRAPWFHRRNWLAYTATGTAAALGASYLGYRWYASRQPSTVFSPDNIFPARSPSISTNWAISTPNRMRSTGPMPQARSARCPWSIARSGVSPPSPSARWTCVRASATCWWPTPRAACRSVRCKPEKPGRSFHLLLISPKHLKPPSTCCGAAMQAASWWPATTRFACCNSPRAPGR